MMYEKAFAEIVVFEEQMFTILSSGKLCEKYGPLDDEMCYAVEKGNQDIYDFYYHSTCEDVTGYANNYCGMVICYDVFPTVDVVP